MGDEAAQFSSFAQLAEFKGFASPAVEENTSINTESTKSPELRPYDAYFVESPSASARTKVIGGFNFPFSEAYRRDTKAKVNSPGKVANPDASMIVYGTPDLGMVVPPKLDLNTPGLAVDVPKPEVDNPNLGPSSLGTPEERRKDSNLSIGSQTSARRFSVEEEGHELLVHSLKRMHDCRRSESSQVSDTSSSRRRSSQERRRSQVTNASSTSNLLTPRQGPGSRRSSQVSTASGRYDPMDRQGIGSRRASQANTSFGNLTLRSSWNSLAAQIPEGQDKAGAEDNPNAIGIAARRTGSRSSRDMANNRNSQHSPGRRNSQDMAGDQNLQPSPGRRKSQLSPGRRNSQHSPGRRNSREMTANRKSQPSLSLSLPGRRKSQDEGDRNSQHSPGRRNSREIAANRKSQDKGAVPVLGTIPASPLASPLLLGTDQSFFRTRGVRKRSYMDHYRTEMWLIFPETWACNACKKQGIDDKLFNAAGVAWRFDEQIKEYSDSAIHIDADSFIEQFEVMSRVAMVEVIQTTFGTLLLDFAATLFKQEFERMVDEAMHLFHSIANFHLTQYYEYLEIAAEAFLITVAIADEQWENHKMLLMDRVVRHERTARIELNAFHIQTIDKVKELEPSRGDQVRSLLKSVHIIQKMFRYRRDARRIERISQENQIQILSEDASQADVMSTFLNLKYHVDHLFKTRNKTRQALLHAKQEHNSLHAKISTVQLMTQHVNSASQNYQERTLDLRAANKEKKIELKAYGTVLARVHALKQENACMESALRALENGRKKFKIETEAERQSIVKRQQSRGERLARYTDQLDRQEKRCNHMCRELRAEKRALQQQLDTLRSSLARQNEDQLQDEAAAQEVINRSENGFAEALGRLKNSQEALGKRDKTMKATWPSKKRLLTMSPQEVLALNTDVHKAHLAVCQHIAANMKCQLCQVGSADGLVLPCEHQSYCIQCLKDHPPIVCPTCNEPVHSWKRVLY